MKQEYKVEGMSCEGCRSHVEKTLDALNGVLAVQVNLEKKEAIIEAKGIIPLELLQNALQQTGTQYKIYLKGENVRENPPKPISKKQEGNPTAGYYCPMHCEGEKIHATPGSCSVCGMDLVEDLTLHTNRRYSCPMHPEIISDKPGDCPICGMDLLPLESDESDETKGYLILVKKLWIASIFTIPIFLIAMSEMIPGQPLYSFLDIGHWNWIQFGLSIPVVFYSCWMFFIRGYRSLKTWKLNMFTLIAIGAGTAWAFSLVGMLLPEAFPQQFKTEAGTVHVYFEAATVILTLVLLGQLLEARAHRRTNSAVKELLKLAPHSAYRVVDGKEELIGLDKIRVGDILRVKPGDKIPVDGSIYEGEAIIDESMISGEPLPVHKTVGQEVSSGTINGRTSFLFKAEKIGVDTLLSQIINMVNKASRSRAPIQNIADRIAAYFVPLVVIIALITFIIWAVFGPEPSYTYALVNAIAVLIVACPCALGLATPMSVMVGVGRGAQSGVLIKTAEALETLNKIDVLIVDKTGTITEGAPSVDKVCTLNDKSEKELLQYMVALNSLSEHPLGEATVKYGKKRNIEVLKVEDFHAITGKGVAGFIAGKKVVFGNERLMIDAKASISEEVTKEVIIQQKLGKTISFLMVDEKITGYIVIGDAIKESSKNALSALQKYGIEVLILSGDNYNTTKAVATTLGLPHFKAEMLPEDKLKEVVCLQSEGKIVAMAGDGINDAPALAKSNVGIAMGTGTDIAIESADITLIKGDLNGIVRAFKLSKSVFRNIKQNLFFALIYNLLGVPIAAGILYPFLGILLSPMIAALAMSFSSVSVIANALRLRTVNMEGNL